MTDPEAGDDRRSAILRAASEIVTEGGYQALSIRALAKRAGMSLGLLYYYFADKHAVFEALMQHHQARMRQELDAFPREHGLIALLSHLVPLARTQWQQVGRMVAVWRVERPDDSAELRERRIGSAHTQFEALRRALAETAAADGRTLRADREVVPFVWSGLMGLADIHAQGWVEDIDHDRLAQLTVAALAGQITMEGESHAES